MTYLMEKNWQGRKVLITGHTGFKGRWLSLWLTLMGAKVYGISKSDDGNNQSFNQLNINVESYFLDINDIGALKQVIEKIAPEVVFHLAAQALVRKSYQSPMETWTTNIIGSANILEISRFLPSLKAVVMVTSDKCYAQDGSDQVFNEQDKLGGNDPYSASKACAELVIASYRASYFQKNSRIRIASARAGNVIGGGDWSADRLIPDIVRSVLKGEKVQIRSPNAVRPWQHVLESLNGYLLLAEKMLESQIDVDTAWNFGPPRADHVPVVAVLNKIKHQWGEVNWEIDNTIHPNESAALRLDASKAQTNLGWSSVWTLAEAITKTIEWYKCWRENGVDISHKQILEYVGDKKFRCNT